MREKNLRQGFANFVVDFYDSSNHEEDFEILNSFLVSLGFDGTLYTCIPKISLDLQHLVAPVFKVSNTYSPDFLKHYFEAEFNKSDFTINQISAGRSTPINWWSEVEQLTMTSEEKNVLRVARDDYKIRNGITIPTISTRTMISGGSFISYEKDEVYKVLLRERLSVAQKALQVFHDKTINRPDSYSEFIFPVIDVLSEKERLVLWFLSTGYPMSRVQEFTGIPQNYANNLSRNIRDKLGAETREQLMYFAGLLEIEQYL